MAGFAKIFGAGDTQVLVMRSTSNTNDERVEFYAYVDGVGVKRYCTTFRANETAASDANAFFNAVDEALANARANLIRENWASAPQPDSVDSDPTTATGE